MSVYVAGELGRVHPTLFEALCLFEALVRLGFGEGQIHAIVATASTDNVKRALVPDHLAEGDSCLFVRLRARRERPLLVTSMGTELDEIPLEETVEWHGAVGLLPYTYEAFSGYHWPAAVRAFADAPRDEAEPMWQASRARRVLPRLEGALRAKGIAIPRSA